MPLPIRSDHRRWLSRLSVTTALLALTTFAAALLTTNAAIARGSASGEHWVAAGIAIGTRQDAQERTGPPLMWVSLASVAQPIAEYTSPTASALRLQRQDEQRQQPQALPARWKRYTSVAPITDDDLEMFIELLGLSRAQRLYFQQAYDSYLKAYDPAMEAVENLNIPIAEANAEQNMGMYRRQEAYRDRLERVQRSADGKLFDAMTVMLSDEQIPAMERVRMLRKRHVYTREWGCHFGPTGSPYCDMTEFARRFGILNNIDDILATYEPVMTSLTRKFHEEAAQYRRRFGERLSDAGFSDEEIQRGISPDTILLVVYKEMRVHAQAIRQLNDATSRQIEATLDDQSADRWGFHYSYYRYSTVAPRVEQWWRVRAAAAVLSEEAKNAVGNACLDEVVLQFNRAARRVDQRNRNLVNGRNDNLAEFWADLTAIGKAAQDVVDASEEFLQDEFPAEQYNAWRQAYDNAEPPWKTGEARSVRRARATARRQVPLNTLIDVCVHFGVDRAVLRDIVDEFSGANRKPYIKQSEIAEHIKLWQRTWNSINALPALAEEPLRTHGHLLEQCVRREIEVQTARNSSHERGDVVLMPYMVDPDLEHAEVWLGPIIDCRARLDPLVDEYLQIGQDDEQLRHKRRLGRDIALTSWTTFQQVSAKLPEEMKAEFESLYITMIMPDVLEEPHRATMVLARAAEQASITADQALEIAILAQGYEDERRAMTQRMMNLASTANDWFIMEGREQPNSEPIRDSFAYVELRKQRDLLGQQARRSLERLLTEKQ